MKARPDWNGQHWPRPTPGHTRIGAQPMVSPRPQHCAAGRMHHGAQGAKSVDACLLSLQAGYSPWTGANCSGAATLRGALCR